MSPSSRIIAPFLPEYILWLSELNSYLTSMDNDSRDKILQSLQKEKILAIPAADNVIRFLPPYIIESKHIDASAAALDRILKTI